MRKLLVAFALFVPFRVLSQTKADEYVIYSNYLHEFEKERCDKCTFAIKMSTNYNNYRDVSDISDVLGDFRDYVKNKKIGMVFQSKRFFLLDTLKQDTLWLPLIAKMIREIRVPHVIKNNFPGDLKVFLLPYTEYYKYYGATNEADIEAEWATFHDNYSDRAVLVDISQVVTDGKRAVFYYGWRCGGLCGDGSLVMFYKEGAEWKFVTAITMWYN